MDIIGIDAGGSWIKAARFSSRFDIEEKVKIKSGASVGVDEYYQSIAEAVEKLRTQDEVSVGLALPGLLSADEKRIVFAPNIEGLNEENTTGLVVADELAKHVQVTSVRASNDANLSALAEWQLGELLGDNTKSMLHITWGTGIGVGLVRNGVAHYGWEGGHVPLTPEKTLEQLTQAKFLIDSYGGPTEELLPAAEAGDEKALSVIQPAVSAMAQGLHIFAAIALPDLVTLGGGICSPWLIEQVKTEVAKYNQGILQRTLRPEQIKIAELENDAGMIGAGVLAANK